MSNPKTTSNPKQVLKLAAALGLGLIASLAAALPEDQQQPIHVTADSAVQENNTVTYRGNVVIVQGTIQIAADQVVLYHDKGKLQRAVATGKPVHFQQQPDTNGGLMTGHAITVVYYSTDQRVELLQDALVDRDQSTLKGQRIEYLLPSKVLRAEGASTNQPGRVEMVLQPGQADPKAAPSPTPPISAPAPPPSANSPSSDGKTERR
jgi:lipopolysaccharide export system protein LptA